MNRRNFLSNVFVTGAALSIAPAYVISKINEPPPFFAQEIPGVKQLARDLATFNNQSLEDATNSITKAWLGEVEAMKALGIVSPKLN